MDQTAARRYWPGQDPLGKKLMVWGRPFTVVGVAKNSTHMFVNESPEPMAYMSFFQLGYETIVQVETEGNPADLAPAVTKPSMRLIRGCRSSMCAPCGRVPRWRASLPSYKAPWQEYLR